MSSRLGQAYRLVVGWGLLLALAAIGGCASGPVASEAMDRAAKSQVVPPDRSALYFFRPSWLYGGLGGAARLTELELDGESRTHMGSGNYAFKLVKPGEHTIVIGCGCTTPAELKLSTAPGQAYYVRVEGNPSAMPGLPQHMFTVLPPEEGKVMVKDSRLVHWLP